MCEHLWERHSSYHSASSDPLRVRFVHLQNLLTPSLRPPKFSTHHSISSKFQKSQTTPKLCIGEALSIIPSWTKVLPIYRPGKLENKMSAPKMPWKRRHRRAAGAVPIKQGRKWKRESSHQSQIVSKTNQAVY